MRRRNLLKFIGGTAVICALVPAASARSQTLERTFRLGYLSPSAIHPAFRDGLRDIGYVEGKNLVVLYRHATEDEQYTVLARELVDLKVDLILAVGVSAVRAAKQATRAIPIVMGNASDDPVREGLVRSLSRPGENVTGVIDLLPELAGKRVQLLKEIFPKLSRIAHLSPGGGVSATDLRSTEAAARQMGIDVRAITVSGPNDLDGAFQAAAKIAEALVVVGVGFFITNESRIVNLEIEHRLPAIHAFGSWVPYGGLISYSENIDERYRRAAFFVDKILKGASPAELPVEQPTNFLLRVNLKTARTLDVVVPQSIILRADEVIE